MDKSLLLGLGLDCKDGHLRITKGKNFRIYGGSHKTHEEMQEKAIKFNEHLDKRRKRLDEISTREFYEISDKVGLSPLEIKGR
ncbi:MAG: hypothetical protein HQ575_00620 [Candidatus Omnitrophica bacterium]|nr:hypothetical protein [Candidatus Omnitrophota bacterium]